MCRLEYSELLSLPLHIVGMMGVSSVGGAYYPQHPGYPADIIQHTNERLATFRHHLSNPSGYTSVARSLVEWVLNPR